MVARHDGCDVGVDDDIGREGVVEWTNQKAMG